MKKNLFVLFFCFSLGLFFTADSKSSIVTQEPRGSAIGCLYTGTFGDICSFLGYGVIGCQNSHFSTCLVGPPSTP